MKHRLADFFKESNDIEGYVYTTGAYYAALQAESLDDVLLPHIRDTILAWNYIHNVKETMTHEHVLVCHSILMQGKLESKYCGQYRDIPVWVGGNACTPPEHVHLGMSAFLDGWNAGTVNPMELHYAFETVHPFMDGNGRLGRLLWAADLLRKGKDVHPILDNFDWEHTGIFNVKRANYYEAIQSYRNQKTA